MAHINQNNSVTDNVTKEDIIKKIYSDTGAKDDKNSAEVGKSTSLTSLIIWNVTKALELNPKMDVKNAMKGAQARLDGDIKCMIPEYPEERHLTCALLAWQQLGHTNADSLCAFVDNQSTSTSKLSENIPISPDKDFIQSTQNPRSFAYPEKKLLKTDIYLKAPAERNRNLSMMGWNSMGRAEKNMPKIDRYPMGPVIKLPIEPKIVMRLENSNVCARHSGKKACGENKEIMNKIEKACCMESACAERLRAMDKETIELRTRAARLAQREAERVQLLERAEGAWKDLEKGYQRRLNLAEEKEEDIAKQVQKMITERNSYKNACMSLAKQLKEKGDCAENDRARLVQIDKQLVCEGACKRQRLSTESAKTDAMLSEQQCKAAQFDRDLLFQEEQARRKKLSIESELVSAKALTHEAERALRAELAALKDQVSEVSNQLLEEDAQTERIKELLGDMRQEKMNMIMDLEGCKKVCDGNMQSVTNELKQKRQKLVELKDKVMECRCKLPVDASVEAKRTPSLAELCRCTGEDKILESCSCTSVRGRLLNNLLSDLFNGLQTELGSSYSAEMPCQLLKCLEDKHNWDRASIVKTNLRNYFSRLLLGELDIAIANSIEKYHAKWVGETCADTVGKLTPSEADSEEGWQERIIEKRAQKLASELAEQLFKERADQLTQQAMEYIAKGPPPCTCQPANTDAAVYPCLVKAGPQLDSGSKTPPPLWKEAMKDVTQLRMQIEDLKKDSIKKQDLKQMELKIAKIMKQAPYNENNNTDTSIARDQKCYRSVNISPYVNQNKYGLSKKRHGESVNKIGIKLNSGNNAVNLGNDKNIKFNKCGQIYHTNPCLSSQREYNKLTRHSKANSKGPNVGMYKPKTSFIVNNVITTRPIEGAIHFDNLSPSSKSSREYRCTNVCFHRAPSNTSIDKLLDTLTKWKTDLGQHENKENINRQSELVPCQCPATKNKSLTNINKKKKTIKKHNCLGLDFAKSRSESSLKSKRSTASLQNKKKEEKPGCKLKTCASSTSKIKTKKSAMCSIKPCKSKEKTNRKVSRNDSKLSSKSSSSLKKVESEYMGAINLDKSNDDVYKCCCEKNKTKLSPTINAPILPVNVYKCITSSKCNCDKVMKTRSYPSKRKDANNTPLQGMKKDANKCLIQCSNEINPASACNYNIQFLGVTLADVDSNKQHVGFTNESNASKATNNTFNRYRPTDILLTSECGCLVNPNAIQSAKKGGGETVSICRVSESRNINTRDRTCECVGQFHEFKNYIDIALQQECSNNDKALDTQSFFYPIAEKEDCVCCNNNFGDESKQLEENAFYLLEEHLKQKLQEFKETSCQSSCISPQEEEILFSTILKRVKKVISESTNKISCKCSEKGGDGQGSWSRAYGLLQEYLKLKIKRVQCSCALAEDNKDTILPDVLDKVSNLIENDFKRLKDICDCQHKKDVLYKDSTNFTGAAPEKDLNVNFKTFFDKPNSRKSVHQENVVLQVSDYFGMDAKSCDPMETYIKKSNVSQNVQSFQTLNSKLEINSEKQENQRNRTFEPSPLTKKETELLTVTECSEFNKLKVGSKRNRCLSVPYIKPKDCSCNGDLSKLNLWRVNETQKASSKLMATKNEHCVDENTIIILDKNHSTKSSKLKNAPKNHTEIKSKLNIRDSTVSEYNRTQYNGNTTILCDEIGLQNSPISPYIGYTIDCSCENKLGKCVCGRATFKPNNEFINDVWKNSKQNKNYFDKVAYILNNNNAENKDKKKEYYTSMTENLLIQPNKVSKEYDLNYKKIYDRETETDTVSEEEHLSRDSNKRYDIVNTMTNTHDDNNSVNTDYSINEESLDWCECSLQIKSDTHNQYKKSIYYPAPLQDIDDLSKNDVGFSDAKQRKRCNCDMVPICHVKMLVENIEDKLASSKCTCDSLIPKVCPVHTPK